MHKKMLKIVLVLGMVAFCAMNGGAVFAYSGGAIIPGNNPTAGGCRPDGLDYSTDWWDTCFGASWQKYEVVKDLPEDGVYFYYTGNTGTPIAIRGCKKGQYVYNYGLEVYDGGGSTGYQVSTQRNKDLPQAPHGSVARGGYGGTVSEYLRPVGYASAEEAKDSYDNMVKYIEKHPEFSYVGNLYFTWDKVGAFCYAEEADGSEFEGKTEVTGAATKTVGYTNKTDAFQFATINNCSVTEGCKVSFRHSMRRISGDDSTSYTVARTSNFIETGSSSRAIPNNSKLKTGTFDSEEAVVSSSGELTLYPGMVVCEKLVFSPNSYTSDQVNTRVCVRALGSVDTSLNMKVKNNSVEKYNNYTDVVYAKPGDEVTYKAEYKSVAQYTRRVRPEQMQIDNGEYIKNKVPCNKVVASSDLIWYCQLEVLYNGKKYGSLRNWNNGFTVFSETFSYLKDFTFNVGDEDNKEEINSRSILDTDVGKELSEKAETNKNDATKTTVKRVEFVAGSGDKQTADVNVAAKLTTGIVDSDVVRAYVPYNFRNKTNITEVNNTVYAGETTSISYDITTGLKDNGMLDDTYVTKVDGAKWGLEFCYGEKGVNCDFVEGAKEQELHNKGSSSKYIYEEETISNDNTKAIIDIPDAPAGTKFWVRSAVYPRTSGGDGNWQDPEGDHEWAYSEWTELTVAKKPSFQVWGGSIYSAGNLNLKDTLANKSTLANYGSGNYVFGSWTELSLIAIGKANGIASGVGLGYANNDNGALWPDPNPGNGQGNNENIDGRGPGGNVGVGDKVDYCKINTLSFANGGCVGGSVGFGASGNTAENNKELLISRFNDGNNEEYTVELHDGDYQIEEIQDFSDEEGKTTKIIKSDGSIIINGDINYNDGEYEDLESIPKIIIFAKNNIDIACGVTRIDAVLIAENNVNTCSDSSNINARENSTPLRINGSIIADTLNLNRTYGAAIGANSMVPAEIINYDASLYLWASGKSDVIRTGKIVNTYQIELSPRY